VTFTTFNNDNFHFLCDELASKDDHLRLIIKQYGYPPLWSRVPSFTTLIRIILEQQVSLSSAKAAFIKLSEKVVDITPEKILLLTDEEMKACYFSRQKIKYARHLAASLISGELRLNELSDLSDDEIRTALKKIKGIGDWTVDVYLMMALNRCDHFPVSDIALIKSIKEVKSLLPQTTREEILVITDTWRPYRTIAAFLLWHAYIKKRNLQF
jgi:DNA-3-methyladenine glycosylase II